MALKHCSYCGAFISRDKRFCCSSCGQMAQLQQQARTSMSVVEISDALRRGLPLKAEMLPGGGYALVRRVN